MDEISFHYIVIPLIVFIALFVKSLSGTGTTSVIIALSSFIIDPKLTIVLSAFINIFGGLFMLRIDPIPINIKYWGPIAFFMMFGSVLGAWALKLIEPRIFEIILGTWFFITALRFLLTKPPQNNAPKPLPEKANSKDVGVGVLAGFCGGFIGINAPVFLSYFSKILDKRHLRRLLVIIFIPGAFAQTGTFYWNGMLSTEIVTYGVLSIPAILAGIYVGNKAFQYVSETWFKRLLGAFLCVVSLKLIF